MDPAAPKRTASKVIVASAEEPTKKRDKQDAEKRCRACVNMAMRDKKFCQDCFDDYLSRQINPSVARDSPQDLPIPSTSATLPDQQSLMSWIKTAVSQSLKETVLSNPDLSVFNRNPSIQEDSSDDSSSSDEELPSDEISVFDQKHLTPLIRAIRRTLNLEDASQPSTSLLFSKKAKMAFPIHKEVQDLIRLEWEKISRRIPAERRIEKLYPFSDDIQDTLNKPPSVDAPVARLSRKTALPIDDISALKNPMDRRMETELKKCYISAGAACKPSIALVSVTKALSLWAENLEQAVKDRMPREKILEGLEDFRLASNFCLQASLDLVQLSARSMSFAVAARRALWVRSWFADTASKNSLCKMPFEGKKLFVKALDDIISKSSGGKSTFLPQSRRFPDSFRRRPESSFRRRDDTRGFRFGRDFRTSNWRAGQTSFRARARPPRSPKSSSKAQ
ncbi:lamina-associated polypeptide 2-like [Xenopus laevis]|uniref:Lamina-associated polypeptide 2-like n=1 Tax=Xenopus laevis TaxID=8355 RepID=A0A8J1MT70_XENLA|nr:lamina-associated polypeptide 2-like [Xenopus laevis]